MELDTDSNHSISTRRNPSIGARHYPQQPQYQGNRGATVTARSDKRYEALNREHADSYSTFRNVSQLWDKPLFMVGTV